ncbi:hypothetical protein C8Q72DRAFT_860604 [Fomitopsis betulina]|nr:hypothetical protein C8Q72DRAFT_860604 [Fomitopsis betulina]
MPFLGGGRACIGFKFSPLEMKVALVTLLAKLTFAPSDRGVFWNLAIIQYLSKHKQGLGTTAADESRICRMVLDSLKCVLSES